MKTFDKISILCMGLMLLACAANKEPVPDTPAEVKPEPETRTLTFVLPEDGEKTAWIAGDQIIVHGEYAKDQVTVTLEAKDIVDNKTATCTVSGLYPYVNEECTSTLYAAYPADAVDNLAHCFFYTKFKVTDRQIMAAYNDATDKFQFQNLCGSISFEPGGDYDSFTIIGNRKESLGFDFLQVMLTDAEQNYLQYTGSPVLTQDCKASSVCHIYFPAGTEIPSGFFIKFRDKNGNFVKSYTNSDPVSIKRAQTVSLGNISAQIVDYDDPFSKDIKDLDTDGNANCYIVTEPGKYKFKAVFGNDYTSYIEDAAKADVLWETWNDMSEVQMGSVVASASYAEDYVIIHTPSTLHPGNAVVAVRDAKDNILWSWHIWVPKTAIVTDSFGGIMGKPLMDRNLGALVAAEKVTAPLDTLSYGLVYQWGRKDPFTGAGGILHYESKDETTGEVKIKTRIDKATWAGMDESIDENQGTMTLAESISSPRRLAHVNNANWLTESTMATLWAAEDGSKTIYDPCPAGYHVPTQTSDSFWSKMTEAVGWQVDAESGWYCMGDPVCVFPLCGYRDDYSVEQFSYVGVRALYWTSKVSSADKAYGADIRIDKNQFAMGGPSKSRLGAVRCVSE